MKSGWAMIAAMLLTAASPAPGPASVGDLAWLAGTWVKDAGGEWTEESWSAPRGGIMLGHSLSGAGDTAQGFEFLMLQPGAGGVPAYVAQPGGKPPVSFALVDHGPARATFENAGHDYPQRIAYVRDGDRLTATISSIDGSQAMSWTYRRR